MKDYPVIILGHELYDALPIYIFEYSERDGWCEVQINVNDDDVFEFVLSDGSNQNVKTILKPEKRFSAEANMKLQNGDRIEISSASANLMVEMCDFLKTTTGASLIMDYGEDHAFTNSIRGIKKHEKLDSLQ